MQATIALCVTYYNERELLTELIRSVAFERDRPEEIIVYDDCSAFPAQDFVPENAPVRIIRGAQNRGPAFGRNRLLEHASADYVHFHDSDNFFLPGWLMRVRQVIEDCAPEAVFTEAAAYAHGELHWPRMIGLTKLEATQDLLSFCLENAMVVGAGTFNRKLLMKIGGYPETLWLSEDYAFNIRLAINCSSYALIAEPLIGIRVGDNGLGRGSNPVELDRHVLKGLKLLAPDIPISHQAQLVDTAIAVSRRLYRLGDMEGAHDGFSWATSLGRATYRNQPRAYRLCARVVGPFYAEMIGAIYRRLPKRIREAVR